MTTPGFQWKPIRRCHFLVLLGTVAGCLAHREVKDTVSPTPLRSAPPVAGAAQLLVGTPEEFTRNCEQALNEARGNIGQVKAAHASRAPKLAMAAYDRATAALSNASARANLASNVLPSGAMRHAAEQCEQNVEALNVAISLDRQVYEALKAVDISLEPPDTQHWIERTLLDFRRGGVDRDEPTRAKVKALNEELLQTGQEFARNIREDVRKVEVTRTEMDGLPEDYLRAHPLDAQGKATLTTNYPDLVPFLIYSRSGAARERLWRAARLRGYPKNVSVLEHLLAKRHELASLLGYPNWAAYATEDKMTKSEKAAAAFIDKVAQASEQRAKVEYATLLAYKERAEPGSTRVEPWEQAYLEDRFKSEKFGFDSQALRPYFEYSRVKQGVMEITSRMFGVSYRRITDAVVWSADVETYDVLEGEQVLGRIHLDMHPREGKFKHAAQFTLTTGQRGIRAPEGVLVCNFPVPGETPALLQHSEVETFFHEFGHLLHHVFAGNQRWATLSGVRTEWDFVEVPSMLLQEWASDPQVLALFARHYQTQQPIPLELVQKLKASREFGKALATRRQMFLSAVSLAFHQRAPGFDPSELMSELQEKFVPFRREVAPGTYFHLSFGHLEGYSALYYTYEWSVVIAKDLLTVFEQHGMMDAASAKRLRTAVLEPGGSKEAARLVHDFLGRDYGFKAYESWLNAG